VTGSDPIESGGLFVGRRGGPVRFRRPDVLTTHRRFADNVLADNPTIGVVTSMIGCLVTVLITAAVAKRVDHGWKLVRRAAGHDQERGAVERIFVVAVIVAAIIFGFWFLILTGPGPSVAPRA
jgi:hypothetical protein